MSQAPTGGIHDIELWDPDLDRAATEWGWLLTEQDTAEGGARGPE